MRLIAFITLLFLSTLLSPWILILLVALYRLKWFALELMILALLIDSFYGVSAALPIYTLGTAGLVFLLEWIKPKLLFYSEI